MYLPEMNRFANHDKVYPEGQNRKVIGRRFRRKSRCGLYEYESEGMASEKDICMMWNDLIFLYGYERAFMRIAE